MLISGGTAEQRTHVAFLFHRHSLQRHGPFVGVDCAIEESRLRNGLEVWLFRSGEIASHPVIQTADRGTLFLDSVSCLTIDTQRLLVELIRRRQDAVEPDDFSWSGRLIAGCAEPLAARVREQRFLPALFDALDKVRIDLGATARQVACSSAAFDPALRTPS